MASETLVALLSLGGTLIGSLAGILTSARLTNFRLQALEEKVKLHNQLSERIAVNARDIKTAHKRIDRLDENCRCGTSHFEAEK